MSVAVRLVCEEMGPWIRAAIEFEKQVVRLGDSRTL